jgi:hypothetical protein
LDYPSHSDEQSSIWSFQEVQEEQLGSDTDPHIMDLDLELEESESEASTAGNMQEAHGRHCQ